MVSQLSPRCGFPIVSQLFPNVVSKLSPGIVFRNSQNWTSSCLQVSSTCHPVVLQMVSLQLSSSYFSLAFRAARLSLDFEAATAVGLQSWGPIYPPFVGSIRLALMENSVNSNPPALRLRWNPGRLASIVDGCK